MLSICSLLHDANTPTSIMAKINFLVIMFIVRLNNRLSIHKKNKKNTTS